MISKNKRACMRLRRQLLKYATLGVVVNALGFVLYLAIVQLAGFQPVVSISIVYPCICLCNYFGNKVWTFRDRSRVSATMPKYLLVQGIGYLSNLAMLSIFNGFMGLSHAYVQLFSIAGVALLLFLLSKYVVFRST